MRPYAWLTKLYMLYRKKFYPERALEATEEDAARTRELIRQHLDVEELERDFPTYVLDEHFLTKLKDQKPEAKAAEVAAAVLGVADRHCFAGWWNTSAADPELSRELLLLIAQRFGALGLLAGDTMEFIGTLVQLLKRKHYKPGTQAAE